jgi:DNA polymerase I-like protein with 3'-5' exonuclease and polymerase domains
MIAAFQSDEDLHRNTAAAMFRKPLAAVTADERQMAKAFNLGVINGQMPGEMVASAKRQFDLDVTVDQAHTHTQIFMDTYPGIRERLDHCYHLAKAQTGEVRTRSGRRRIIPDDTDQHKRQGILLNTPIQGGTADGMKRAMALLHQRLPLGALLVCNIHDELIVECPTDLAEEVKGILVSAMVEGMQSLYPEVAIKVDAAICQTWADKA